MRISYETQIKHYTSYIKSHRGRKLAGIFAEDSISGTYNKHLEECNHMIEMPNQPRLNPKAASHI